MTNNSYPIATANPTKLATCDDHDDCTFDGGAKQIHSAGGDIPCRGQCDRSSQFRYSQPTMSGYFCGVSY